MLNRNNFIRFILCCPNQHPQNQHIQYSSKVQIFKSQDNKPYKNIHSLCKNNQNPKLQKISIKNIKRKQKNIKKQLKIQEKNSIHLQNTKSLYLPTNNHNVCFTPKIKSREQPYFSHQRRINYQIIQDNYTPIQHKQILQKNICNSIYHPLETTVNKNISSPNLSNSKATQKNKPIFLQSSNYIILSPAPENKSQESIMTIKKISSLDRIQFDKFQVQAIESSLEHSKKLQQIAQERHQETFEASKYLSVKKQMVSLSSEKNIARKSDLQMVKASIISQNQEPNDVEITLRQKISQSKYNPQMTQIAKRRKYQTVYGYSIMSINSCIEQVNQSKIQHSVQESQVMNDFFNPAKNIINKWSGKSQ